MPPDLTELQHLLKENNRLVRENNDYLRKMHRSSVISFWLRLITFLVLLGLPVAAYFYIVKPYVDSAPDGMQSIVDQQIERFLELEAFTRGLMERQGGGDSVQGTSTQPVE